MAGWDSESELGVDGQVGGGPQIGAGGKVPGAKAGGPGLYMIEPSGLYWVRYRADLLDLSGDVNGRRVTTVLRLEKGGKQRKLNWKS